MRKQSWLLALCTTMLLGWVSLAVPAAYASTATLQTTHVALASCSGSHCNGQDAYSTGCAGNGASYWVVDSVPVNWRGVNYGWDQLWYSGSCGTNWARYACSSSCRSLTLMLMVCNADGSHTAVEQIDLNATGRTKQYYLPHTKASAYVRFNVAGTVFSGTETGCY